MIDSKVLTKERVLFLLTKFPEFHIWRKEKFPKFEYGVMRVSDQALEINYEKQKNAWVQGRLDLLINFTQDYVTIVNEHGLAPHLTYKRINDKWTKLGLGGDSITYFMDRLLSRL